jgi:hypothetical protein
LDDGGVHAFPLKVSVSPTGRYAAPLHALADGITSDAISRFEPHERRSGWGWVRGLRTLRSDGARTCYVLRLRPSREYVTCSGRLARSQVTCGTGERDEHQMLWMHNLGEMLRQNQKLLRANRVTLSRGVSYSNYSSIGAPITPSRGRRSSFSMSSPGLSQSHCALSRGGVPFRLGRRRGGLLAIRKRFVDRLTDGGQGASEASRGRAHDREPCSTPASCSKPQLPGKGPLEPAGGSPTSGDRCRHLGARGGYSERTDPRWRSGPVGFERVESVPGSSGHALEGG